MFGFLKKKLKESIDKLTGRETASPLPPETVPEQPKEEPILAAPEPKLSEPATKLEQEAKKETTEPVAIEEKILEPIQPKMEVAKEFPKPDIEKEAPKPVPPPEPTKPQKKGLLEKLGLKKPKVETATKPTEKKPILSITKKQLSEKEIDDVLSDLKIGLLESDVALDAATAICESIKKDLSGSVVSRGRVEDTIKESFRKALVSIVDIEGDLIRKIQAGPKPFIIVFLGFNGAGKTTTIARLGYQLKKNGLKCVMAAGDTWRAAAIQQLEIHGEKIGVPVVKHDYGADSAAVVFDAVKYAKSNGIDVVLADTAGRTHTNANLMDELKKVCRVNNPQMKILIIDSLTGNDALDQAEAFERAVGVDGIILTKMDVNEKGGAALSVAHAIKKPIFFIGVGQGYEDLEKFDPKKFVEKLLS